MEDESYRRIIDEALSQFEKSERELREQERRERAMQLGLPLIIRSAPK
jgi:hypothetical protein